MSDSSMQSNIKYKCMVGCTDYEEHGITACNDCITEWKIYLKADEK